MGERLPRLIAALTVALGVAAVLAGASVFVEAWQANQAWAGSAEAQHAAVPSESPIWLDEPAPAERSQPPVPGRAGRTCAPARARPPARDSRRASQAPAAQPRLRAPDRDEAAVSAPAPAPPPPAPAEPSALAEPPTPPPAAFATPADVELADVDFRFLDPPEPGAHARLAVSVLNRASVPTGPLSLAVPARWLNDFQVFGAIPAVLDDRARGDRRAAVRVRRPRPRRAADRRAARPRHRRRGRSPRGPPAPRRRRRDRTRQAAHRRAPPQARAGPSRHHPEARRQSLRRAGAVGAAAVRRRAASGHGRRLARATRS